MEEKSYFMLHRDEDVILLVLSVLCGAELVPFIKSQTQRIDLLGVIALCCLESVSWSHVCRDFCARMGQPLLLPPARRWKRCRISHSMIRTTEPESLWFEIPLKKAVDGGMQWLKLFESVVDVYASALECSSWPLLGTRTQSHYDQLANHFSHQ